MFRTTNGSLHIFNILTIKKSNIISLNIKRFIPTEQIHTRTNHHLVSSLLFCNGLLLFVQTRKIRFIGDGMIFKTSAPFFSNNSCEVLSSALLIGNCGALYHDPLRDVNKQNARASTILAITTLICLDLEKFSSMNHQIKNNVIIHFPYSLLRYSQVFFLWIQIVSNIEESASA